VVRAKAEGEGDFAIGGGEGKVKEGSVDEKEVNQRVGLVVLPGRASVRDCDEEGVIVEPLLEDGCPGGE
jgi:hypothetical protein